MAESVVSQNKGEGKLLKTGKEEYMSKTPTISCPHTVNGMVVFKFKDNHSTLVKCQMCGCVFDIAPISSSELHDAVRCIRKAVIQIDDVVDEHNVTDLNNLDRIINIYDAINRVSK